jgi:UDP-N-acetylmuramoylalanine--D-glutamate ligase
LKNALAAMAIASSAGVKDSAIVSTLKNFKGLPHRCELIAQENGISWVDDSKGTNIGATQSALESFPGKKVILIAGGDAKGSDISQLGEHIDSHVKQLLLIGKDAPAFYQHFSELCPSEIFDELGEVVTRACELAEEGDVVLLSPACSSLDMFSSYQERGIVFRENVERLLGVSQ